MFIKGDVEVGDDSDEDVTGFLATRTDQPDTVTDAYKNVHFMFHTPSFGEDDFDFLQQEKTHSLKGNFSQDLTPPTTVYTEPQFSLGQNFGQLTQAQAFSSQSNSIFPTTQSFVNFGGNSVINSQQQTYSFRQTVPQSSTANSIMTTHRDSILDTLESIAPKFPPQNLDLPDITVTNGLGTIPVSSSVISSGFKPFAPAQMYGQTSLSTTLKSQLGTNTISPTSSTMSTVSPVRDSSEDSDDSVPLAQLVKRQAQDEAHSKPVPTPKAAVTRKPRTPKKKKKKDPNEPQKPVSAYALFFRDTQAAIKGQNPNATFGEVSKIVASMWEGLDPEHKSVYKKRTDMAKKEYLKQLAAYRASLVSQTPVEDVNMSPSPPHRSPLGTSPQHMMGYNNNSPQHLANSAHMASPAHMTSPQHMGSPAHMGSPMHATSPQHVTSPHHMSPPQHMPSPQHVTSPNHMTNHVTSPNHIPSPQHNNMFNFNTQQTGHYNDVGSGYSNGQMSSMITDNMEAHTLMSTGGHGSRIIPAGMCIRSGCNNRAIDNIGWDSEYCSNECVVSHCRDVFTAWVANRQVPTNCFTVK